MRFFQTKGPVLKLSLVAAFLCAACSTGGGLPQKGEEADAAEPVLADLVTSLAPIEYMSVDREVRYSRVAPSTSLTLMRPDRQGPHSTIVLYHSGWTRSAPEHVLDLAVSFLRVGFAVVNVDFRLGPEHPAPAAVYDARCALQWVYAHTDQYNLDHEKIVTAGPSSGGHLAMMAAFGGVDEMPGYECTWSGQPGKVAAVVTISGLSDVPGVLFGDNSHMFARRWFLKIPDADKKALAERLSPINHVSSQTPPIINIHGDDDPVVPFEHALRMQRKMDEAERRNRLIRIEGGGHGLFNEAQTRRAYDNIERYLRRQGVWPTEKAQECTC